MSLSLLDGFLQRLTLLGAAGALTASTQLLPTGILWAFTDTPGLRLIPTRTFLHGDSQAG